jgi:hypothetical protein
MERKASRSKGGISPWAILPVGATVSVHGRTGRIVARHYMFAAICYDGEQAEQWHWVRIGWCVERHDDSDVPETESTVAAR